MKGSPPRRRNLVIVRAGARSLHPTWLINSEFRDWDIVVSVYDDAVFQHGEDAVVIRHPGGKWDGISEYLLSTDALDKYDYIWLPDDDIATNCPGISNIFAEMRRWDLDICQPSLRADSYYTHFFTLSCPGLRLRYVNFVEIMIPCVVNTVLKQLMPDLRNSMSGFGMDPIWCRLSPEPAFKAAILDGVAMKHTRPVGGGLHKMMAQHGRSATTEADLLNRTYGIQKKIRPLVYAMIDDHDRLILGTNRIDRLLLGINMCIRYSDEYRLRSHQEPAIWKMLQLLRRQAAEPLELWQLSRANNN